MSSPTHRAILTHLGSMGELERLRLHSAAHLRQAMSFG